MFRRILVGMGAQGSASFPGADGPERSGSGSLVRLVGSRYYHVQPVSALSTVSSLFPVASGQRPLGYLERLLQLAAANEHSNSVQKAGDSSKTEDTKPAPCLSYMELLLNKGPKSQASESDANAQGCSPPDAETAIPRTVSPILAVATEPQSSFSPVLISDSGSELDSEPDVVPGDVVSSADDSLLDEAAEASGATAGVREDLLDTAGAVGTFMTVDTLSRILADIFEENLPAGESAPQLSQGELVFVRERMEREGLINMDDERTQSRVMWIVDSLLRLQGNLDRDLTSKKTGSFSRRSLHRSSSSMSSRGRTLMHRSGSVKGGGNAANTCSDNDGSVSSGLSRKPSRMQKWREEKAQLAVSNPMAEGMGEAEESEESGESVAAAAPTTAAYFQRRSKKRAGTLVSNAVGAAASLATQVNVASGVRSIWGQTRTASHMRRLKKIKRELKCQIEQLEENSPDNVAEIERYRKIAELCGQAITAKKNKSIHQGKTTAISFIPLPLSAAGKVVSFGATVAGSVFDREKHQITTAAQNLHGLAHEEIVALDRATIGETISIPALAIVRELFAHAADKVQEIETQKGLLPDANERVQMADNIAREEAGWSAVLDKMMLE